MPIENHHNPIIGKETREQVQELRKLSKRTALIDHADDLQFSSWAR